jgi:antiviral helicase SKI2
LHKLECEVCLEDINKYYDLSAEIVDINQQLLELASTHVQGSKSLSAGRVVVLRDGVRCPLFFGVSHFLKDM